MNRSQLEHIIRASAGNADAKDIIVIGSQSVLASFPNAPDELTQSMEADVFPRDTPSDSILIDGAIGEMSTFHETFGYYAHGVAEDTAVLPEGWKDRLVPVHNENTGGATGWCLEPHDLARASLWRAAKKTWSSSARCYAMVLRMQKPCEQDWAPLPSPTAIRGA